MEAHVADMRNVIAGLSSTVQDLTARLQVAETAIYTRNTHSDANNDVVSDDCLCLLSNGNFIANAVNFLLLEPPVNLFIIPTLGLTFFSICLSCQYVRQKK